jgi:hypothetical protein
MASQGGNVFISLAWGIKRRLLIRTRFRWAMFRLWKYRFGIRPLHNFLEDMRWGGYCGGLKYSPHSHLGANATQSMDYAQLSYLFRNNYLPVHESDVLVDVGCGKGRVINYWLARGLRNRMIGIELDEEIASAARIRLARHRNVEIIASDVSQSLPEDGTLFFLFNPFGPAVMKSFMEHLKRCPGARMIYWYCLHLDIIENDPWWHVEQLSTGDHKQAVLIRPKAGLTAESAGRMTGSRGADLPKSDDQQVAVSS